MITDIEQSVIICENISLHEICDHLCFYITDVSIVFDKVEIDKENKMKFEYVKCNLCNSDNTEEVGKRISPDGNTRLETNIVKCSSCGLMYPNPMPHLMEDEIQNSFNNPDEYFSEDIRNRFTIFENTLSDIEKVKPEKGRILDVGCGRGEFLYIAERRGWEVIGTDISKAFVDYARKKFNVNALVGDFKDIDLPLEESFDVICLISVIQYLQNPLKILKKINLLLKSNGILYIETTNEDALVFKIGDFYKSIKEGKRVTTHLSPLFPTFQIYGFNKKAILKALKIAGFEILYIKIKGRSSGGRIKGCGLGNKIINFMRRIIVFMGDITGNGHLIYCIARKDNAVI